MRKTYDKAENINDMFNYLEKQIQLSGQKQLHDTYFYHTHEHKEVYLSLRGYFNEAERNAELDAACYITALPEIFQHVDIFELQHPMAWTKNENGNLSDAFKKLTPHFQYLALAASEACNITFRTKPSLSLGLKHWNIEQLKIFWQFTAIARKNAM